MLSMIGDFRVSTLPLTRCIPPLLPLFINDSYAKDAILILQFRLFLVFWLVVSVSGSWIFVIESSPDDPANSINMRGVN